MSRRPTSIGALAAGLVILAVLGTASCSSDGDDASKPTTTTTTTTTTRARADGGAADAEPVPSPGCGSSTTRAVELERRTLPGSDRWYLLTTPDRHDGATPLPLVLDFHGLSEGAELHRHMSGMSPKAQEEGFVVAFPNGTGTPVRWQISGDPATNPELGGLSDLLDWPMPTDAAANPDRAFVADLLDALEADLCVDTSRIYASGISNGAMMASMLGCTMADRFAAFAAVAGLLDPSGCPEGRAIPVLAYHGTEDPILLFGGGVGARLANTLGMTGDDGRPAPEPPLPEPDLDGPGYPAHAQAWAERNGCTGDPIDEALTATVTRRTWDCPADAPVLFDIVEGGGHSWPGSEFSEDVEAMVGPTDTSIDATDEIWSFFTRWSLPTQ